MKITTLHWSNAVAGKNNIQLTGHRHIRFFTLCLYCFIFSAALFKRRSLRLDVTIDVLFLPSPSSSFIEYRQDQEIRCPVRFRCTLRQYAFCIRIKKIVFSYPSFSNSNRMMTIETNRQESCKFFRMSFIRPFYHKRFKQSKFEGKILNLEIAK